jgi:GcrA cell cycle regulator
MSLTYLENRHNIYDSPWTDELIERLKLLWAKGLSASQIAAELKGGKFTRMSVIGKVHRLKLPARKAREPGPPYLRKRQRRANGIPKPPAPPPRPKPPPPPPPPGTAPKMRRLPFAKIKSNHCRWPCDVEDLRQPARLFCAADVREGEVYCEHHYRKARVPERKR